jgi:hypothetical protein
MRQVANMRGGVITELLDEAQRVQQAMKEEKRLEKLRARGSIPIAILSDEVAAAERH